MSRKDSARKHLKDLEALIPVLSRVIPEKELRKGISKWRHVISNPRAKWPKPRALDIELERVSPSFKNWAKTVIELDADQHNQQIKDVQQEIRTLLAYPETYHDNYDDLHPKLDHEGKPMLKFIEWYHALLKERQTNKTSHTEYSAGQVEMPKDEKTLKRMYKKYVKEWKKKND